MRHHSRRDFLSSTAWTLGVMPFARLDAWAPQGEGARVFRHGVASGDPLADRVMLWTRVTTSRPEWVDVQWQVATDPAMRRVVARGDGRTGAARDFTVKVDVTGLSPATTYYYRFISEGTRSMVGRTRTLPRERASRMRLGVVSCSNYPQGFFNAYAALAVRADLDAVVHLGDYIYEYPNAGYGDGLKLGRVPDPDKEIVALADYRARHAQYKADPDSQAVHRQHPFIVVWDDHELANNTWWGGAENHNPERGEGTWEVRRDAAVQAFFEWMPIREDAPAMGPRIYRTLRFGNLADLMLLDTRLVGRDQQTTRSQVDRVEAPGRSLLGLTQEDWLRAELVQSKRAGTRWQILGQQVMFAPLTIPNSTPNNTDTWEGYRACRDRVFDMIEQSRVDSVAILTGDVHSSWAYDVPRRPFYLYDPATGRGSVAVEIVTTSVSSPSSLGTGPNGEKQLADLRAARPHLHYVDGRYRGYVIVDLTAERVQADFYAMETIQTRSTAERFVKSFAAPAGQMHFTEQASPSARVSAADPAP